MTRNTKQASAALGEQFARLAETPERTATADELAEEQAKIDRGRAMAARRDGRPMPVEQPKPSEWPARISMTASPEMKRDLELARLDDGIEVTARLRAMITLWQKMTPAAGQGGQAGQDLR